MSSDFPPDTLHFPLSSRSFLDPYLPPLSNEEVRLPNELSRPFTTLTFATSLDSSLSIAPGVRTVLSGPQSKAMTHYLRYRHDAILIGVGTASADDPGLNCRIEGAGGYEKILPSENNSPANNDDNNDTNTENRSPSPPDPVIQDLAVQASSNPDMKDLMYAIARGQASPQQLEVFQNHTDRIRYEHAAEEAAKTRRLQESLHQPRPIVIDPKARWVLHEHLKIIQLVKCGKGKAPFVIISKKTTPPQRARYILENYGGKFIALDTITKDGGDGDDDHEYFDWNVILNVLAVDEHISSLMIEGGGSIINSLLSEQQYSALIDSVIVTIAPTWLGQGGVVVSPNRRYDDKGYVIPASRLTDVKWHPFGEDVVLCGRILRS